MIKKSDLKTSVGFSTVQQLNPYLELLQIPVQATEIPEEVAETIRIAVPLVGTGLSIQESLRRAIAQIKAESSGGFEESSQQQIQSGLSERNKFLGQMLQADLQSSATDFMFAYYQLLPSAIHSPAVNDDPRVQQVKELALKSVTGGQADSDFFTTTVEIFAHSNMLTLSPSSTLMLLGSSSDETPVEKSNLLSGDRQHLT